MRYAGLFGVQALLLAGLALHMGGTGLLLLWPALSFLTVALAYGGGGARLLGKRADGTLHPAACGVLLPYLLLTWGVWHLACRLSRERAFDEVVPGVLVGRRLLPGELPERVQTVLDLTAEFAEPEAVRSGRRYLALPILDASTLPVERVAPVLRELAAQEGPVYVHCAQGHGRTGMIAAALLVARGHAPNAEAALAQVQRARPGVRLSHAQQEALDALSAVLQL